MDFDLTAEQTTWLDSCRRLARDLHDMEPDDAAGAVRLLDRGGALDLAEDAVEYLTELCLLAEQLGRVGYRGLALEILLGEIAAPGLDRTTGQGITIVVPPPVDGRWAEVVGAGSADRLMWMDPGPTVVADFKAQPISTVDGVPAAVVEARSEAKDAEADGALVKRIGPAMRAAEMVGGAAEVIERTVAYTLDREVFGRPIAKFQAVQHALANAELHRWVAQLAVLEAMNPASAARALFEAARAYTLATTTASHLFAGIGHMDDHWLPGYYARAKALDLRTGGSDGRALAVLAARGVDVRRSP